MKYREQKEFAKNWVGVVSVKTGESKMLLTSLDVVKATGKIKLFPNNEETLKLELSVLPKEAKRVIKPNDKTGKQFRIRLNEDGDEVEAVQPVMGMFTAKLVELGPHKKDMPPVPFVKTYNAGQKDENSHLEFWASYEITSGVFKGVILPAYYMHYKFEADEDGMTQHDTQPTSNATQLFKLTDWLTVHGNIGEEPIEWNTEDLDGVDNKIVDVYKDSHSCEFANILPVLQERALEANREVNVIIEKGYIQSVQAIVDYEDFSDGEDVTEEEIDEKFPAKNDEVDDEAVKELPIKSKAPAKSPVKKLSKKSSEDDDL